MSESAASVDLDGKVAVVSGASSGIGRAIALRLAAANAALVVGGRDPDRTMATSEAIAADGRKAAPAIGDIRRSVDAEATIGAAVDAFGGVDILVNAAGVIHRADATGTSDDDWARVMAVNVDGTFFMSRAAIPVMRERGGGVIVNVSSTCGLVGAERLAAYCAAKGAVTNLTRAMALDHARDGIRINAICPGAVDTPMLMSEREPGADPDSVRRQNVADIPQGRIAGADEIAEFVLFLCSDGARHITGANLPVDGGYTAR